MTALYLGKSLSFIHITHIMMSTDLLRSACVNCKSRKKKCDKVQPRCGYCTQKKLECSYQSVDTKHLIAHPRPFLAAPSPLIRSSLLLSTTFSDVLSSNSTTVDSTIYLQTLQIIRATGQFIDDITARYFRGIHSFIPIISRPRFHDQLVQFGAPPPVSFSILLLSMCLITHQPGPVHQISEPLDTRTFYITTKTLFAQVQASSSPSLHLIQACTIIAAYEYATGKFQDAFTTIGLCARMGYASRIHLSSPDLGIGRSAYLQAEEEGNTWWGIVACERYDNSPVQTGLAYLYKAHHHRTIYCEIANSRQPFATRVPPREARLPTEPTLDFIAGLNSTSETTGGFACMAQAVWLLDEVFRAIEVTDLDARLTQLDGLNHTLRTVLAVVMDKAEGAWGSFCAANTMIIRALFILHSEILHEVAYMSACKRKSPEQWLNSSRTALDSITKMVQDIAMSHNGVPVPNLDTLPPSCAFVTRAALLHVDSTGSGDGQLDRARTREQLQIYWEKFNHRWNVVPHLIDVQISN